MEPLSQVVATQQVVINEVRSGGKGVYTREELEAEVPVALLVIPVQLCTMISIQSTDHQFLLN